MIFYYLMDFFYFTIHLLAAISIIWFCSCNDRNREQIHLQRRQALRNRQREAVISGKSVRSVIETEVESEESQCPRLTCVRMTPRLKNNEQNDLYQRLNKNDASIENLEKEKPPCVEMVEEMKKSGSKETDSEDKVELKNSAEEDRQQKF